MINFVYRIGKRISCLPIKAKDMLNSALLSHRLPDEVEFVDEDENVINECKHHTERFCRNLKIRIPVFKSRKRCEKDA